MRFYKIGARVEYRHYLFGPPFLRSRVNNILQELDIAFVEGVSQIFSEAFFGGRYRLRKGGWTKRKEKGGAEKRVGSRISLNRE